MSFTYNIATDAGKVRLLATDTNETYPIFDDDEIGAFLALEGSNVRRAAALALETIASKQILLLKVIKVSNLETSGDRLAKELRERAKALRTQADEAEAREDGGAWDVAEMVLTDFNERERWNSQLLRGI